VVHQGPPSQILESEPHNKTLRHYRRYLNITDRISREGSAIGNVRLLFSLYLVNPTGLSTSLCEWVMNDHSAPEIKSLGQGRGSGNAVGLTSIPDRGQFFSLIIERRNRIQF